MDMASMYGRIKMKSMTHDRHSISIGRQPIYPSKISFFRRLLSLHCFLSNTKKQLLEQHIQHFTKNALNNIYKDIKQLHNTFIFSSGDIEEIGRYKVHLIIFKLILITLKSDNNKITSDKIHVYFQYHYFYPYPPKKYFFKQIHMTFSLIKQLTLY